MKLTRFVSALLILVIVLLPAAVCVQAAFNPNEVYSSMVAMKSKYPEGMNWDNSNEYAWNGGIFAVGFGCAGFAFILSDAAFGDLPARMLTDFSYGDVRVGDIVRINGNTHSVIVLEKHTDHVIIAEGNFNHSIHWGRKLSRSVIESGTYVLTRYPEGVDTDPPKPVETVKPFTDVPVTQFYADAVRWAVDENITKGTSATKFSPNGGCTRGQVVTFLWRALGCPKAEKQTNPFNDVPSGSYYYDAVLWAVENGVTEGTSKTSFSPDLTCTRAQIVTFLWRTDGAREPDSEGIGSFTDVIPGSYYFSAVSWAVLEKITEGTSKTAFSPGSTCTRGQVVTFLFRYKAEK